MVTGDTVTVIVRSKDEAAGIGRTLTLLRDQRVDGWRTEIVVVDSGSTDGTTDIVREHGVTLIEIPAASFTFAASLNTGCERASGSICVALSAHAYPQDDRWLQRMVDAFADERVACASGQDYDIDGTLLTRPVDQDGAMVARNPFWGYSNAAGGFRTALWRQHPFRPDMLGTEDKEWAWHI